MSSPQAILIVQVSTTRVLEYDAQGRPRDLHAILTVAFIRFLGLFGLDVFQEGPGGGSKGYSGSPGPLKDWARKHV